jgi:hypothetical protein
MTLVSKMEAAENGLLVAMQAQAALTGVQVQLGDPGSSPPREIVWITEDAEAAWDPDVTMGTTPSFDELYELHVKVLVFRSGDDYTALRDRAAELSGAVETAVGAYRTLNGAVDDSYVVGVKRSTGATNEGRGIETEITIRARATVV